MRPTRSQCRESVRKNALHVAANFLRSQGRDFVPAETLDEALDNQALFAEMVATQSNIVGAASVWMQNYKQFGDKKVAELARKIAGFIYKQADDCFYDRGEYEVAIALYQLASGLDEDNEKYLWGTIGPCLQGAHRYPEVALPYAILVSYMNPDRNVVSYIEQMIERRSARAV